MEIYVPHRRDHDRHSDCVTETLTVCKQRFLSYFKLCTLVTYLAVLLLALAADDKVQLPVTARLDVHIQVLFLEARLPYHVSSLASVNITLDHMRKQNSLSQ